MFYQELYQLYNDMNGIISEELIENIDKWLALMPANNKSSITVGRFSSKFYIEYSISRAILEKMCDMEILERIFEIHCPECNFILKISNEDNLYEDILEIKSHETCYNCDEEIAEITSNNIEVRYKLIKEPTNDPEKVKKDINKLLKIDEDKYSKNTIDKILKENNYDTNKLFYKPTEEQYHELDSLLRGVFSAKTTQDKGNTLEEFVEYLMNLIKPITATRFARTTTNQLDTFAVNKLSLSCFEEMSPVLCKMGHTFICECKNEKSTPKNGYFGKLALQLINSRTNPQEEKFGIIFSKKAPPRTYLEMAKKTYYLNKVSIITFYKDELEEIVNERVNFLSYIDYKLALVHEDLIESKEVKNTFL